MDWSDFHRKRREEHEYYRYTLKQLWKIAKDNNIKFKKNEGKSYLVNILIEHKLLPETARDPVVYSVLTPEQLEQSRRNDEYLSSVRREAISSIWWQSR